MTNWRLPYLEGRSCIMVSTRGNFRSKRFRASSSKLGLRATISLAPRPSNHYGLLSRNNSMRNACYAGKKRVLLGSSERKKHGVHGYRPRQNIVTSWLKLNGRNARIRKYIARWMLSTFFGISARKKKTQKKKTSVYILSSVLKKVCKRLAILRTQIYFEWIKSYNYCIRLSFDVKNYAVFGLQPRWITFYLMGKILHIILSLVQ